MSPQSNMIHSIDCLLFWSFDTKCEVINSEAEDQHVGDIFEDLVKLRKGAPANIICGYLNINSYRNKYEHIVELLQRNIIDISHKSFKTELLCSSNILKFMSPIIIKLS
jgi:hypothetical protein